ncbi:MAG: hypothetical protein J3T61_12030 [Candidatus Brocadiales bacterium]|nr:hypothetical protein [Candidatus Bathyanammoxibius sp.]
MDGTAKDAKIKRVYQLTINAMYRTALKVVLKHRHFRLLGKHLLCKEYRCW